METLTEFQTPVAECRTVAIGIVPLCRVVTPVYKHRDNDCTQWCDLDSDSPALSHRFGVKFSSREIESIVTIEIRNFKLWEMPKLLNFRFPEG